MYCEVFFFFFFCLPGNYFCVYMYVTEAYQKNLHQKARS